MARHGMAPHGTAWHSVARRGVALQGRRVWVWVCVRACIWVSRVEGRGYGVWAVRHAVCGRWHGVCGAGGMGAYGVGAYDVAWVVFYGYGVRGIRPGCLRRGRYRRELVPDLRDYYVVWKIASVAFQQSIRGKLDPKVQEVAAALRAIYIETADAVRPEQVAAVLGLQQVTIYKWLKKGMEAGVIQREEKGKYVPVGVTPNGDSLQVLPTPNEVVELDPSLGVGIELVDPITGQTMVSDR